MIRDILIAILTVLFVADGMYTVYVDNSPVMQELMKRAKIRNKNTDSPILFAYVTSTGVQTLIAIRWTIMLARLIGSIKAVACIYAINCALILCILLIKRSTNDASTAENSTYAQKMLDIVCIVAPIVTFVRFLYALSAAVSVTQVALTTKLLERKLFTKLFKKG